MTDRRHDVSVLDCSIRDGGCCNEWQFSHDLVRRTFTALRRAGVDYMEIGYQSSEGSFDRDQVGPWRFCDEDVLRQVADESGVALATMIDYGRIEPRDLRPASDSIVRLIRCACYAKDIEPAIHLLEHAQSLGYDVMCNVMAVSQCSPRQVDHFLGRLHDSTIGKVALVDSFGAFYPHHVRYLIRKYKNWLRPDQQLGVHFHNNQQTAFANSVVAIEEGAQIVDATIHGVGRGAGNCPLELLLMYLDAESYDVRPILELIGEYAALRDELHFGYHLPYAVTGWLNLHPRDAIRQMASPERLEVLEFYERMTLGRVRPAPHRPILGTGTPMPAARRTAGPVAVVSEKEATVAALSQDVRRS